MSLEIPELDDQEYAEIIENARQRIPVYSETWTNHNASDPGITILELLAWLAETYVYQLDRITDAHRLKYLALLGETPRPPRPASVDLRVSLPERAASAKIERSTQLVATDESGGRYAFETTVDTRLTAARIERVITDGRRGRHDHSAANETPGMNYAAFGEAATRGGTLYLGFDGNPFFGIENVHGTKTIELAVGLHEEDLPDPATHGEAADAWTDSVEFEPSVAVEWQHCTNYERWYEGNDDVWAPLDVEEDGTNGFYRSGRVTLKRPDGWENEGGTLFGDEPYRWIRCVVTEDGYEIAPRLDSIAVNVVPVEHRRESQEEEPLRDPDGNAESTGLPGQTFAFERSPILGTAAPSGGESGPDVSVAGEPWERRGDFDTSGPYDEHYVLDPARGEVRFGDGSRGKIPPEGASITTTRYVSGGGSEGNVPASVTWTIDGSGVEFWSKSGRGSGGTPGELTVVQRDAATGETDAESIDEAFDRLVEDRRVPYRAVSLADYEYLATHTPDLRFGRAAARVVERDPVRKRRPGHDTGSTCRCRTEEKHGPVGKRVPSRPSASTAGRAASGREPNEAGDGADGYASTDGGEPDDYCDPHRGVRVVVVPYSRSSRPTPSEGFVEAVASHLDEHRLLTDWVTVERPTYVDVDVDVEVSLEPGVSVPDREGAIEEALRTFLDPLRGFEDEGWPFGRTLYRSELYAVVEDVTGVDCVTGLVVRTPGERRLDDESNVVIEETELFSPGDLAVTARIDPETNGRRT